jgi:AcrR family transcriptional regulator
MSKTEKIIEAAGNRFRYYGIAKTTMQEIAQDAGVAVGTLYLYFKNKDDLVVACTVDFVERHLREAEAILTSQMPADQKLRRYITGRFRAAEEIRTGSRHAAELTRAVLRLKPDRLEEEARIMWETVAEILRQGVANGAFRVTSIEDDAKVFLFSTAYFFPNALNEPQIPATEPDLMTVVNWFIDQWSRGSGKQKTIRGKKRSRAGK